MRKNDGAQPELFRTFRLPARPSDVAVRKVKEPPLTAKELQLARDHYKRIGGCCHKPAHAYAEDCITALAKARRGYR